MVVKYTTMSVDYVSDRSFVLLLTNESGTWTHGHSHPSVRSYRIVHCLLASVDFDPTQVYHMDDGVVGGWVGGWDG